MIERLPGMLVGMAPQGARVPLSVLDLSPIGEGSDAGTSLKNSRDLAGHVERLGFKRFWLAEHHNMPGIASAATAVVIAHVAAGTSTIRIGAGGIMLPNHAPLMVAEQFGTLATLYPGRIDLGLGRAPGTDMRTARALRRGLRGDAEAFPQDVLELLAYFEPAAVDQAVQAVPGAGLRVPLWILGSSTFGAQLAAALGLPFAFASHFAPASLHEALSLYRTRFEPSAYLDKPYAMVGYNVFAAETDAEAQVLATSMQQAFVNMRTGRPGLIPRPQPGYYEALPPSVRSALDEMLSCTAIGAPETVRARLARFVDETQADEVMVASMTHDHAARCHAYALLARAWGLAPPAGAATTGAPAGPAPGTGGATEARGAA